MTYYLGIDCGGSKTSAVVTGENDESLGRGSGGPCNIASTDDAAISRALDEAISGAAQDAGLDRATLRFAVVCAGVAGYSADKRRGAFEKALRDAVAADAYRLEPDYVIAFWGATHGEPGIAVIAGTGAVAYGRNAAGEAYREDGLGYLLGDRGSGFDLGLRVLRHAHAQVRQGQEDALTRAVKAHTGTSAEDDLVQWVYGCFSPARVAALAPLVGELAESGDPEARKYVAAVAHDLRCAVREVRHRLWMPRDTSVYTLGGLWGLGGFLRSEFSDPRWMGNAGGEPAAGGRFNLAEPLDDPDYGAALLAREEERRASAADPADGRLAASGGL